MPKRCCFGVVALKNKTTGSQLFPRGTKYSIVYVQVMDSIESPRPTPIGVDHPTRTGERHHSRGSASSRRIPPTPMRFRTASLLLVLIPLSLHECSVKIQVLKPGLARRQILLPALRAGDDVAGTASLLTPNITVGPVLLKLHVLLFRTCCDGPRFAEGQSPQAGDRVATRRDM